MRSLVTSVMKLFPTTILLIVLQALRSNAQQQFPLSDVTPTQRDLSGETWSEKYGGTQPDLAFTGPLAFSHLPYFRCLEAADPERQDAALPAAFDIALLGMPFDMAVSYRPGARFGPTGIRLGSRRIRPGHRSWSMSWGLDPYQQGLKIIDCGDVSACIVYDQTYSIKADDHL